MYFRQLQFSPHNICTQIKELIMKMRYEALMILVYIRKYRVNPTCGEKFRCTVQYESNERNSKIDVEEISGGLLGHGIRGKEKKKRKVEVQK